MRTYHIYIVINCCISHLISDVALVLCNSITVSPHPMILLTSSIMFHPSNGLLRNLLLKYYPNKKAK